MDQPMSVEAARQRLYESADRAELWTRSTMSGAWPALAAAGVAVLLLRKFAGKGSGGRSLLFRGARGLLDWLLRRR